MSNQINIIEKSKNQNNEYKSTEKIRNLDLNNEGIFAPESNYFTVYDTFNRPSTKFLPGMGISLYLDDQIYIEYIHYDVVHAWYRECYKRVFIYHRNKFPQIFSNIFPIIKKTLNSVGVSLDTIELRLFNNACNTD